jgi:menaquinone-specific isochorismate synthase
MTVTSHRYLLSDDSKAIIALLKTQRARSAHQITSLEFGLPDVDPLLALQTLCSKSQPYFYWEQGGRSIAMIGSAATRSFTGADRFAAAQEYLKEIVDTVASRTRSFKPAIYCRFPFFDASASSVPFATSHLCLPQWQIERQNGRCALIVNVPAARSRSVSEGKSLEVAGQEIAVVIDRLERLSGQSLLPNPRRSTRKINITGRDSLENSIDLALQSIAQEQIQKIVLAHTAEVTAPNLSISDSVANLRDRHPHCYTFATSDGLGNCFLGASPERLVTVRDGLLIADALAGSAPRDRSPLLDRQLGEELLADPKEQHEHRLVRDFIANSLVDLGLHPQWSTAPRLLQLANIQHLWTPIRTVLPSSVSPLAVVGALHPTPAVAGLPRDLACAKIREYEQVDRSLYAAPLGWIDIDGDCEFVVGIRSALVTGARGASEQETRVRLYAGAGIVAGSQVSREVAEIQLKLQPLYQSLSI